jgi:hypothetical protein
LALCILATGMATGPLPNAMLQTSAIKVALARRLAGELDLRMGRASKPRKERGALLLNASAVAMR